MLATLVIFLREGVEASMIVAILLAYLNRIGKREHFRDVFLGVGAALLLATATGASPWPTRRASPPTPGRRSAPRSTPSPLTSRRRDCASPTTSIWEP